MTYINLEEILNEYYPKLFQNKPEFVKKIFLKFFNNILYIHEINEFFKTHDGERGIEFINSVCDYLNFSFSISDKDISKIPSEGRLICVANHPIGSLDSLSLLKAIYNIRNDVKIIANDILLAIEPVNDFILPFKLESKKVQKENVESIGEALENEQVVIMFPAAEVSRLNGIYVRDGKWNKGCIYFARKYNAPILPVYVKAKNSCFFYFVSLLNRYFSRVLLAHELFNKKNKTISLKFGDPIPAKSFQKSFINDKFQTKLLKKHVYSIGKDKRGTYTTEQNIIHPIDRKLIKKELNNSKVLGITSDDKMILLTTKEVSPNVITEVARLREITFRKVGEGTGKKLDIDKFDDIYKHIIVWDEKELEIVGSYRLGIGKEILEKTGVNGFYTSTLFDFSDEFVENYIADSIELGRSFVQKKYWNTNALHYLWQGIGAFLAHNNFVKYMFGGVSISDSYPLGAKRALVYYFNKWFGSRKTLAKSKNKFEIPNNSINEYAGKFTGENQRQDYFILKNLMKPYGFTVPILYKHYSELCEDNGVSFIDFGIDNSFEQCIDGLILVDIDKIKQEKKDRYINCFLPNAAHA
ncbi:MAG: lysophospholipid acyltransferase family protein [Ignavibacteria bacterium]|jgi:putative hemolysin